MLIEKYGEPFKCKEEFQNSDPIDDYLRVQELKNFRCDFFTIFSTELGHISLNILYEEITGCRVSLTYIDLFNSKLSKIEAADDL